MGTSRHRKRRFGAIGSFQFTGHRKARFESLEPKSAPSGAIEMLLGLAMLNDGGGEQSPVNDIDNSGMPSASDAALVAPAEERAIELIAPLAPGVPAPVAEMLDPETIDILARDSSASWKVSIRAGLLGENMTSDLRQVDMPVMNLVSTSSVGGHASTDQTMPAFHSIDTTQAGGGGHRLTPIARPHGRIQGVKFSPPSIPEGSSAALVADSSQASASSLDAEPLLMSTLSGGSSFASSGGSGGSSYASSGGSSGGSTSSSAPDSGGSDDSGGSSYDESGGSGGSASLEAVGDDLNVGPYSGGAVFRDLGEQTAHVIDNGGNWSDYNIFANDPDATNVTSVEWEVTGIWPSGDEDPTISFDTIGSCYTGTFRFTPPEDFVGEYSMQYRYSTDSGTSNWASFYVEVLQFEIDIDVDSDNDGVVDRSEAEEAAESYPGKRTFKNFDDDNANGKPDWTDTAADYALVSAEDKDFIEVKVTADLPDVAFNNYSLKLTANFDHGNIWADKAKTSLDNATCPPTYSYGGSGSSAIWDVGAGDWSVTTQTFWAEGASAAFDNIKWELVPNTGPAFAEDSVALSVEDIVWPSNETAQADKDDPDNWASKETDEWNGFDLPSPWGIENSLCEIINNDIGSIRTEHPSYLNGVQWEGNNSSIAEINVSDALGLSEGASLPDSYRVTVDWSYEDGPHSQNHYVDYMDNRMKPGFFCNSGVKIDGGIEMQIYDTASLLAAFNSGQSVIIDGQTVTVNAVTGTMNGSTFVPDTDGDGVWEGDYVALTTDGITYGQAEQISALISGILYDEPDEARTDWSGQPGSASVLFDSYDDLAIRATSMTIDVYRNFDALGNLDSCDIKVTCGDTSYYYEELEGSASNIVTLQSHCDSGVRFESAKVEVIPLNERR